MPSSLLKWQNKFSPGRCFSLGKNQGFKCWFSRQVNFRQLINCNNTNSSSLLFDFLHKFQEMWSPQPEYWFITSRLIADFLDRQAYHTCKISETQSSSYNWPIYLALCQTNLRPVLEVDVLDQVKVRILNIDFIGR